MRLDSLISKSTAGSAGETGSWRILRPVVDEKKCSGCKECFYYCPEGVIQVDVFARIDYRFCKGCGVCGEVCRQKAIVMVPEE
ncbi:MULTISPECIES: 4Fe-4S binding protein [Archaeoglobus]|jgi:pyruvate ferredoxin oxidoreductase delta subunit|uniref:2-ketoisovalerate ferredoxin oxidoreductase, subunit delta (VorD) n=3 Tax=Archaeoglobus fulgidus TaxID=2234 RepID=O28225_ARCFU|nr:MULTISPECIES: 4Fe-4S binding protein [Archaeoglobus]AAB89211.1 2-ketoisovalerate ferredoxin oxidoreductase, subunit delta (vorD) [Archaeoglobus fulgidus DSM 4304]AIG99044.1 2-oxoacid:acceptor oxidoreductase, delta subunit, pyruvate/2-ketoisovalerate family [Archaeoglobus fulgidus DSM 8774]KUJ93388.1 MAG: 2-ketoisovalerate ferredoxin oxidoreductase, subunit delta (VorD) [Archaeoglobus fulgidus]KUK05695.1 MAG: 2-ketoisovalerate ferredoxin oxidoreductase, subunit delta (VorD) [Archaeoglobus ful